MPRIQNPGQVSDRLAGPAIGLLTAIVYWAAAALSLRFVLKPDGITPVWPVGGIAIGIMALSPKRRWPWIVAGVAAAHVFQYFAVQRPIPAILTFAVANILETLAAWAILTRFGIERVDFSTLRQLRRLFIAAGPVNALTACVAAIPVFAMGYTPNLFHFWRTWVFADGLGMLLVTPVILGIAGTFRRRPAFSRTVEGGLILALFLVLVFVLMSANGTSSAIAMRRPLICTIPFLMWAALRTDVGLTSVLVALFAAFAIVLTAQGRGPFADPQRTLDANLLDLQTALIGWASCGLVVSGSVMQYRDALKRLTESESKFRLLAVASPVAVFQTDVDGKCIYVNERWREFTGQLVADALGEGWTAVVHPADLPRMYGDWRRAVEAGSGYLSDYRIRRPSGEIRWITTRVAPIEPARRGRRGHVGISEDVTDRKILEAELEERRHFDLLIADLSARMVNVSPDKVADAIRETMDHLAEALDADRVTLSQRTDNEQLHILFRCIRAGPPLEVDTRMDLNHPWMWQRLKAGEATSYDRLDDLPPEASIDRENLARRETRSCVIVPLSVGGVMRYALSAATITHERHFSPDLVRRLRVLGETLANALDRARMDQELWDSADMLRSLNQELSRAEDRQRRHLASVLHDDLAQTLFAATTQLVAIRGKPGQREDVGVLDRSISMLDDALRQTRELTFEICPPVLYQVGLAAALQKLAERFAERQGLECQIDAANDGAPLDPDVASFLYHAVRELLMNVVKHAGATRAFVRLAHDDAQLELTVSDEGRGMRPPDPAKPATGGPCGFGLFNIKERVRTLGGRVEVISGAAPGCTVRLTMPLPLAQTITAKE